MFQKQTFYSFNILLEIFISHQNELPVVLQNIKQEVCADSHVVVHITHRYLFVVNIFKISIVHNIKIDFMTCQVYVCVK